MYIVFNIQHMLIKKAKLSLVYLAIQVSFFDKATEWPSEHLPLGWKLHPVCWSTYTLTLVWVGKENNVHGQLWFIYVTQWMTMSCHSSVNYRYAYVHRGAFVLSRWCTVILQYLRYSIFSRGYCMYRKADNNGDYVMTEWVNYLYLCLWSFFSLRLRKIHTLCLSDFVCLAWVGPVEQSLCSSLNESYKNSAFAGLLSCNGNRSCHNCQVTTFWISAISMQPGCSGNTSESLKLSKGSVPYEFNIPFVWL